MKYFATRKLFCKLLLDLGFNYVWLNQGVGNDKFFLSIFIRRINDVFIQEWLEEINNSTRAKTYSIFCDFKLQSYLTNIKIYKFRNALCKLRVSSHRLEIEAGRWHKPSSIPFDDRKCTYCNTFEDEFHFVLECKLYADIRRNYISDFYWKRPNVIKFTELMKSENNNIIYKLSVFVYKAMKLRNQYKEYYDKFNFVLTSHCTYITSTWLQEKIMHVLYTMYTV